MSDILEAVPIDKYFELFKPNAGGEGGFIRISMNYVKDLADLKRPGGDSADGCLLSLGWGLGAGVQLCAGEGLLHALHSPTHACIFLQKARMPR